MAKQATALATRKDATISGNGNSDSKATALISEFGKTNISDSVVAKIASIATREVEGIHSISSKSMVDTLVGIAKKVTGTDSRGLGVNVEVGTKEAAVDLGVVVQYGVSIPDVAEAVRNNVIDTVLMMTDLKVKEVNIDVLNLYFPEDDKVEEEKESRVE